MGWDLENTVAAHIQSYLFMFLSDLGATDGIWLYIPDLLISKVVVIIYAVADDPVQEIFPFLPQVTKGVKQGNTL